MFRLLLLIPCLILATALSSSAQLFTFRNFNHKDGLFIATVNCVSSSQDGSVWLGTDGAGVIRYTGQKFIEIPIGDNKNHHVTGLHEWNGKLYFTSRYYGVYTYSNGKTAKLVSEKTVKGEWNKVFATDSGVIAVTDHCIVLTHNGSVNILKRTSAKIQVSDMIDSPKGIFILTDQGNFYLSKKTKKIVSLQSALKNTVAGKVSFGHSTGSSVEFWNKTLNLKVSLVLNDEGNIFSVKENRFDSPIAPEESTVSRTYDPLSGRTFILTTSNDILYFSKDGWKRIIMNYDRALEECNTISCDQNGDLWLSSHMKGLYKVSSEPFTRFLLHPIYSRPDIMALHRSQQADIFISTDDEKTFVGDIRDPDAGFREFNFRTYSFSEDQNRVLCATNNGIMSFDKRKHLFTPLNLPGISGSKITMLFQRESTLYVGIAGKGLKKYNLNTGREITLEKVAIPPDHFYTTQFLATLGWQIFGTNDGLFSEDIETGKLKRLDKGLSNGSYAGVSIKDVYGNLWFSGEKGITGILENGEIVLLNDRKLFNSTLFYTLNSDNYGNLIIGTNKGITVLQLNDQGKVLQRNVYTGETGFSGYETNMRAQFQDKNTIFVGTVEGLYSINTDVLRSFPRPSAPTITSTSGKGSDAQSNTFILNFNTNNPKIPHLLYTYRIKGYREEWSDLSENAKVYLSNLPNGEYVLQVRSTYDGRIYSDIGEYPLNISLPFWRTRWFIVVLILTIVVVNIYFIQRRKTFDGGNFFRTRDMLIELDMTPTILFFGFVADVVANYIAPLIDPEIPSFIGLSMTSGFLMLSLFLLAKTTEKNGQKNNFRILLIVGYGVVMSHYLFASYFSKLHTFYILPLVMVPTLATYIFERLRHVIIQNLILLITCSVMVLYLDQTVFNKFLFLFMILITCFISIFATYLRYDSLEKLIFVSGIVNKGNVQVVAFNDEGVITYVSENIKDIIPATQDELLNQQISILNNYLPDEGGYRNVDLTKQFYDGQKYLAPMLSNEQTVNWVEWSCKFFSENVRVILGQNVSDKMELENTYELLVENAEDMIYQCDLNGSFKFVNNRTRELLQSDGEELENKSSLDFVQEDYRQQVDDFYRDHFESRKKASYLEFPIVTRTGEVRWVGQHVTTLFRAGTRGFVTGFLTLARDITEKRDQQQIIEEQRDNITSSITYAQRIQLNLLPVQREFDQSFEDHFVIYRSKDIVSGDFYWLHRIDNLSIVALGDCTGHGVPGAFMTLLGINLLNTIVLEGRLTDPAQILNEMDKKLVVALRNETGTLKDGIELTVCTIDHDTGNLTYACAGSRFLIYEGNSFNMYKGDVKHIGDEGMADFRGYISHYLKLENNSQVYLMTDGFQDQFGGTRNKKFSLRRLLELFESNIRLPFDVQRSMIEEEFESWKHQFDQTDDVTVISFRNPKK